MSRPLTRDQLLAEAARVEAERDKKLAEAAALDVYAQELRRVAERAPEGLHRVNIGDRVNTSMQTVHRVAISQGRAKTPFQAKLGEADLTLRSLAKRLGVPVSLLSMYRAKDGRPVPRDRAERIEKLTGWPADDKHWPNGIA